MSTPLPLEPPEPPEASARAEVEGGGGSYHELMYLATSSRYLQTPRWLPQDAAERQRVD